MAGICPRMTSNFETIVRKGYCYVDKTDVIADILNDEYGGTHVYTRPTRFGKSLMLSTLDCFFNVAGKGGRDLFEGMRIESHPGYETFLEHRNAHPVIRLDMHMIDPSTRETVFSSLRTIVSRTYRGVRSKYGEKWMSESTKRIFDKYLACEASDMEVIGSICELSSILYDELKNVKGGAVKADSIILMDEYDAFIQKMRGVDPDTFSKVTEPLADFMVQTFKSNSNMAYGVISGILRLSQTGILSGLNNPVIHDIFDEQSAERFGYTHDEVKALIKMALPEGSDHGKVFESIEKAYDGYIFGGKRIFNPRSVNMYLMDGNFDRIPKSYWEQGRGNNLVDGLLSTAPETIQSEIAGLVESGGFTVEKKVIPSTLYSDLASDDAECNRLYSFMVMTGYLKADVIAADGDSYLCRLALSNSETKNAYLHLLERVRSMNSSFRKGLPSAMRHGDSADAERILNFMLGAQSARDSWRHDDCKKWLVSVLVDAGVHAMSEVPAGNGFIDILAEFDDGFRILVEITTCDEVGSRDLAKAVEAGFIKSVERRYVDSEPDGIVMSVGWDRRYVKVGFRPCADILNANGRDA